MNANNICFIFHNPALYRKPIHELMEREYGGDWYFDDVETDIKCYDSSMHKHMKKLPVRHLTRRLYYTKGVAGLIFNKKYDKYLMLSATWSVSIWLFVLCKKLFFSKKKVYFWTHGWYGKESRMEVLLKKFMFKSADGIFTYGEYAKQLMISEGFDETKIYPIHNSLDYEKQLLLRSSVDDTLIYQEHFRNLNPTIIFIGRLTKIKRLDMLVAAVCKLRTMGQYYNLVFVGDGTERNALELMVRENGLSENVWFFGACYDEKTNATLISNADVCVAPGNIGLTAMHSLVFGTPAISHNKFPYQMPEFEAIKPNVTGDFFNYGDIDSLANTISEWFRLNSDKREEVRQNCYKEIDTNWTPEYQIQVLRAHFK